MSFDWRLRRSRPIFATEEPDLLCSAFPIYKCLGMRHRAQDCLYKTIGQLKLEPPTCFYEESSLGLRLCSSGCLLPLLENDFEG
jgi:hypothetical protein